jgi:hypothetical protein
MKESVFLRGASQDSQEAKKILKEHNVHFAEVYSEGELHKPVLYTNDSAYAYKGLAQIRGYAHSFKKTSKK